MKTIWKFSLQITDEQAIAMPIGAKVLCVQMQGQTPCLWALVTPSESTEIRTFATRGTGHPIPDNIGEYVGTYQYANGMFVFHVFERKEV